MAMLEVKDLSVYYGVIQALKGISFEVEEGDVITCRGLGKCVVKEVPGQSRKGRTMLVLERYI